MAFAGTLKKGKGGRFHGQVSAVKAVLKLICWRISL